MPFPQLTASCLFFTVETSLKRKVARGSPHKKVEVAEHKKRAVAIEEDPMSRRNKVKKAFEKVGVNGDVTEGLNFWIGRDVYVCVYLCI